MNYTNNIAIDLTSHEHSSFEWTFLKILIIFVATLLALITGVGNLLVLISFHLNKQLRTVSNYFLFSLAIADLTIGFISIPIFSAYFVADEWLLGPLVCDFWLSIDYTMSNASVASLLLISFDRYFSITRPLTYRAKRTSHKAAFMIALGWIISFLMWTPAILIYPRVNGKQRLAESVCQIQFLGEDKYITLGTCLCAFYVPVTVMCVLYFKIWRETVKRQEELKKLQAQTHVSKSLNAKNTQVSYFKRVFTNCFNEIIDKDDDLCLEESPNSSFNVKKRIIKLQSSDSSHSFTAKKADNSVENQQNDSIYTILIELPNKIPKITQFKDNCTLPQSKSSDQVSKTSLRPKLSRQYSTDDYSTRQSLIALDANSKQHTTSTTKTRASQSSYEIQTSKQSQSKNKDKKQEQKAVKTLSAILLAFIITWTPYNVNVLLMAFSKDCLRDAKVWESFAYWLCYVNSTINPVLYALCNVNFRKTFKQILLCKFQAKK